MVGPGQGIAELLVGLSTIADVGMGMEAGEAARTAVIATALADDLGAPAPSDVFYTALLQHIGCTAYAHEAATLLGGDELSAKRAAVRTDFTRPREILLDYLPHLAPGARAMTRLRAAATAAVRAKHISAGFSTANCEVASMTAERLGLSAGVREALLQVFEWWNGKGSPRGLRGDDIALCTRIAQVAGHAALFDTLGGPELASETVRRRAGTSLDPQVAESFCARAETLLGELAAADAAALAVAAEPAPRRRVGAGSGLDEVCRAFGEAVDLKSPLHHGHSTGVAALAAPAAARLGLPGDDVDAVRRAALLHDIGRAAVPNGVWEKPGPLTSGQWEQVRLHAYHGERIVERCAALAGLAPLVGLHHERLDGSGYHRRVPAQAIPMPARVIAAADAYQAMTQERAHRPARSTEEAVVALTGESAAGRLDADAVAAVLAVAGSPSARVPRPRPAELTDRQLEVLRLVAQGLSNPQIAQRLVVTRRTAEHHVQDVYAKIGVSTRAGAALFAMQHDLLA